MEMQDADYKGLVFFNRSRRHWLKDGKLACLGKGPSEPENGKSTKKRFCGTCLKLLKQAGFVPQSTWNIRSRKQRKKLWQREQKKIARQARKGKPPAINVGGLKKDEVIADGFLQTFQWRQLRYLVLKERGRRCECCGKTPADGREVNVDHIKPRRHYPELALAKENLQILCHECNHGKGNWDDTDWRQLNEAS